MSQPDSRKFIYRIDGHDRIRFVNEAWVEFAAENSAPLLSREQVVNEPLHHFIADVETRHIYGSLYTRVRAGDGSVEFSFRCDSPRERRFMSMKMSRYRRSWISFECRIGRIEIRPAIALLDPSTNRSSEFLRICSWCKRVDVAKDDWQEVEIAVKNLDLFSSAILPQLTHCICSACLAIVRRSQWSR